VQEVQWMPKAEEVATGVAERFWILSLGCM
jgi:hypothetical protein